MTGLMLKDLLVMRKTLKTYVVLLAAYTLMAYFDLFPPSIVSTLMEVLIMMLPISAFAYDEQARWDRFAMALPMGRKNVVGARYCFTLLLALVATALGLAASILLSLAKGLDLTEAVVTTLVALTLGLLIADILLPLSYKMGPERARPYLYVVVLAPAVLLGGAWKLGLLDKVELSALEQMAPGAIIACTALLPLAALAGLGLSWRISCRIVEGKEF